MKMKVLIFGGNGFLGKALQHEFNKSKVDFFTVSRSNTLSSFNVDISKIDDFSSLPNNFFTVIVNCAAVLPGGSYLDSEYLDLIYKTNILGSQNICNWISSQSSIVKIINCSTLVVVKKPWDIPLLEVEENTYPYGSHVLYCSSKLTQELIFKTFSDDFKIKLAQIRFSTLYGKGMNWNGLLCNFLDQATNNKKVILTNGAKITADFLNVNDAAKIILETAKSDIEGIINGATGIETSLLEAAKAVKSNFIEEISIVNEEFHDMQSDRSVISIKKLSSIINTSKFLTLKQGIKEMLL